MCMFNVVMRFLSETNLKTANVLMVNQIAYNFREN